jgi:hypothetical protein
MKIQSKFTDYYDFISRRYGQDPQIVYVRRPLSKTVFPAKDLSEAARSALGVPRVYRCDSGGTRWTICRGASIVAGRYVFPLLIWSGPEMETRHELVDLTKPQHRAVWPNESVLVWRGRGRRGLEPVPSMTPPEDDIYEVIRIVGAPVFLVADSGRGSGRLEVEERVPILADYGVPSRIPASEMWQNIFHVLSNVLRRNPDKEPPCTVNNEERIQAAGFDLRTSFRNPIKWKEGA